MDLVTLGEDVGKK